MKKKPGHRKNVPMFEVESEHFWRYFQDTGCNLHPACLACPRPQCKYDDPERERIKQTEEANLRDAKIIAMLSKGESTQTTANFFSVSQRTIQRAIKKAGDSLEVHDE
jgi:hypothetical protein